jgi:hypothetical protein
MHENHFMMILIIIILYFRCQYFLIYLVELYKDEVGDAVEADAEK